MQSRLSGVIPPVGTPLADGDRVDEVGLRRLTRHLLDAGINGIFANGSMGGFAFMTDEEQIRAISIVMSEVNGEIPVMGGLGETSTSRAVRKAKGIAQEGVTYLTVLPPFYFPATQENLIAYFSEIAAAVDRPIFLYDNPASTKSPIQPETVFELRRQIPNIVGIKESNEDFDNLQRLLDLRVEDDTFSVLTGSELQILRGLQMGCDGLVGGLHNLCPQIAVALYRAFRSGDLQAAEQYQQDLAHLWGIFQCGGIWGAFDEALRYLGICARASGSPYVTQISEEDKAQIHWILKQYLPSNPRHPSSPGTACSTHSEQPTCGFDAQTRGRNR